MPQPKRINCRRCVHFFITWQKSHPYGCRAMGFKGPQIPSLTVFQNSGSPCLHFQEKETKKPAKPSRGIVA